MSASNFSKSFGIYVLSWSGSFLSPTGTTATTLSPGYSFEFIDQEGIVRDVFEHVETDHVGV